MLNDCKVFFNPQHHRYFTYDGVELQGITGMLKRQLFADKYANVAPEVLQRAAEKGSAVHDDCEQVAMFGVGAKTEEGKAYADLLRVYSINMETTEYTVSDMVDYASKIDVVDDKYNLYDIKTTSVLDLEYIKWQLSVYAYLFELVNPGIKAGDLYGIHLRGNKAKLVKVERIPSEVIKELLRADANGEHFVKPDDVAIKADAEITRLADIESVIISLKEQIKAQESKKESIMATLYSKMADSGISKWETEKLILTAVAPTETTTIDTKALKEYESAIYDKYSKKTPKKGYLKITIKKQKI